MTGGIAAGRLVNRFLFYHPALKYLVIVVKTFLSQRLMNEVHSGGLGSYSIVLICLSFLQVSMTYAENERIVNQPLLIDADAPKSAERRD